MTEQALRTRTLRGRLAFTSSGSGALEIGNLSQETSDQAAQVALDAAWDAGIRYFDTAPHYGLGLSERRLGAYLAGRPRDEFVLSTKVGRILQPSPETADRADDQGFAVPATHRRVFDFSRDGIRRSLDDSLERLGLDRIDVAYLHDPDDFDLPTVIGALETLIELRDEGILGAIGAGMNQSRMPADLIRNADVDIIMIAGRFTLLDQEALDDLLPLAQERGVGIAAAGVTTRAFSSQPRPAVGALYRYAPADEALLTRAVQIAEVCEAHGVTLPDAAVQYTLQHPAVVSVVVGLRTVDQVESAIARVTTDIPPALWRDLADTRLVRSPLDPLIQENTMTSAEFAGLTALITGGAEGLGRRPPKPSSPVAPGSRSSTATSTTCPTPSYVCKQTSRTGRMWRPPWPRPPSD